MGSGHPPASLRGAELPVSVLEILLSAWAHRGSTGQHRLALPRQSCTLISWHVSKALCLKAGFVLLFPSGPLCHFQELFLVISVYMYWSWIPDKSGSSFTPLQMKKVVQVLKSKKSANNYFLRKVKCGLPHYSKLIKAGLKSCPLGYTLVPGDNRAKCT